MVQDGQEQVSSAVAGQRIRTRGFSSAAPSSGSQSWLCCLLSFSVDGDDVGQALSSLLAHRRRVQLPA